MKDYGRPSGMATVACGRTYININKFVCSREMDRSIVWRCRLEGLVYGVGIFAIIRENILRKSSKTAKYVSYLWFSVLLNYGIISSVARERSVLHTISELLFHATFIANRVVTLRYGFEMASEDHANIRRFTPWVLYMYTTMNVSFSMLHLYVDAYRTQFDYEVLMVGKAYRALDIMVNVSYTFIVVVLFVLFIFVFVKRHIRKEGLEVTFNRCLAFYGVLQFSTFLSLIGNIVRAAANIDALSSLWLYPDTFIIIGRLEYGETLQDVLRSTIPSKLPEELQQAKEDCIRTDLSKRNVIKFLHHQLRNNIQQMLYIVDNVRHLINSGAYADAQKGIDYFTYIIDYMTALANDLYGIDSSDGFQLHEHRFDLPAVLLEEFRFTQDMKSRRFENVELDMPDRLQVISDPNCIRQVIRILFDIFMAAPSSELHIHINNQAELTIHAKVKDSIVVDWENKELETGEDFIGVSLKILQNNVKHMGGNMYTTDDHKVFFLYLSFKLADVTEETLRDTVATVAAPTTMDVSEITPLLSADKEKLPETIPIGYKRRMLVVDDSPLIRKLMIKTIGMVMGSSISEWTIDEAENGIDAVELAKRNDYEMIWMDVIMPHMDGIEATRKIKECRPNTRIVLVTANENESFPADLHYEDYIRKPFRTEDVKRLLKEHLEKGTPI